jgi:hypothetical protein
MINVIWQIQPVNHEKNETEIKILNFHIEFITNVLFKDLECVHHFDNLEYKTFLDNSIIIYYNYWLLTELTPDLKNYFTKYDELNLNYILFHLSDEDLHQNLDYYSNAKYIFRLFYNHKIQYSNLITLPIGYLSGYMNKENIINLSDKRDILISFIADDNKSDRKNLVNNLSDIDSKFLHLTKQWNCPTSLSKEKIIEVYKRTIFVPCPMGRISVETLRLYEALEWGCIPIIKRYKNEDYYEHIFGEHPIPIIDDWSELSSLIKKLNNENIDELIIKINTWYKNFMNETSLKIKNIVEEKLNKL